MILAFGQCKEISWIAQLKEMISLWSNDYKASIEIWKVKLLEQDLILKAMTASVMHLEKKLISLENEKELVKQRKNRVMRRNCEEKTFVRRCGPKVVKCVATSFVVVKKCNECCFTVVLQRYI